MSDAPSTSKSVHGRLSNIEEEETPGGPACRSLGFLLRLTREFDKWMNVYAGLSSRRVELEQRLETIIPMRVFLENLMPLLASELPETKCLSSVAEFRTLHAAVVARAEEAKKKACLDDAESTSSTPTPPGSPRGEVRSLSDEDAEPPEPRKLISTSQSLYVVPSNLVDVYKSDLDPRLITQFNSSLDYELRGFEKSLDRFTQSAENRRDLENRMSHMVNTCYGKYVEWLCARDSFDYFHATRDFRDRYYKAIARAKTTL